MSLHVLAKQMAAKGRGPDTVLVHMAPNELAGLQALAKSHGTSLTINPETGLPEAGVLSSILPMVIGAGLTFVSGGALSPLAAAMITGAGTAAVTGSWQKGLSAGLGAWGGAGLGAGLAGMGTAAGTEAAAAANSGIASGLESAAADAAATGVSGVGSQLAANAAEQAATQGVGQVAAQAAPEAVTSGFTNAKDVLMSRASNPAFQSAVQQATPGTWESIKAGASRITDPGGMQEFIAKVGGGDKAMKYGLAALSPVLMGGDQKQATAPHTDPKYYRYDPNRVEDPEADYNGASTGERKYFDPRFVALAGGGGIMDALTKRFKKPEGYMSAKEEAAAAKAAADKEAADKAAEDAKQQLPATGLGGVNLRVNQRREKEAGLAEGGQPASVDPKAPVEDNPYYTMNGMSGDAFKYLMGQGRLAAPPAPSAPVAAAGAGAGAAGSIGGYRFDPATGTFSAPPPPPPPEPVMAPYNPNALYQWWGGGGPGGGDGSAGSASSDGGSDGSSGAYRQGGLAQLAQGGRFLKGPGDGVSDSIPATIEGGQPARLANEEYVIPARVVSELGNGSSSAGAKRLDEMVARVQARAAKTTKGRASVAKDTRAYKALPA